MSTQEETPADALYDLPPTYRPFESSPEIGELMGALAAAQGEFTPAHTSGTGKVGREGSQRPYAYATLNDVTEATRPALSKHGLAVTQLPFLKHTMWATVRTVLSHKSGQWIACVVGIPSTADYGQAPHVIGSATSYARRYGLSAILGVAVEDDDGGVAQQEAEWQGDQSGQTSRRGGATNRGRTPANRGSRNSPPPPAEPPPPPSMPPPANGNGEPAPTAPAANASPERHQTLLELANRAAHIGAIKQETRDRMNPRFEKGNYTDAEIDNHTTRLQGFIDSLGRAKPEPATE